MPAVTRRQCGCTCANRAEWEPYGDALDSTLTDCDCSEMPCEFLVDFGCKVVCGNLTTDFENVGWYTGGHGGRAGHILPLVKDHCAQSCTYHEPQENEFRGVGSEKTYDHEDTDSPACTTDIWARIFAMFGSLWQAVGGVLSAAIPIFGWPWSECFGAPADDYEWPPCGLYDQTCGGFGSVGDPCGGTFEQLTHKWTLTVGSGQATLNGFDGGDTPVIVYHTFAWVCPTVGGDDVRNTLHLMIDNTSCGGIWPKSVCVVPGYAHVPCWADAKECCDRGRTYLPVTVSLGDCGGTVEICTKRHRVDSPNTLCASEWTNSIPDTLGISYPADVGCGAFWGTLGACEGTTLGLLLWCTGSSWSYELYCIETSVTSLVLSGTATIVECCPSLILFIDASGIDPDSPCCCPADPEVCDCSPRCMVAQVCATTTPITIHLCQTAPDECNWNSGGDTWLLDCGVAATPVTLSCEDGVWTLGFNGESRTGTVIDDDPLTLFFTGFTCTVTCHSSVLVGDCLTADPCP